MAVLEPVYWETISPQMRSILEVIGRIPFSRRFYLAGGTALALRLGHRRSYYLDFFSDTDEVTTASREEIISGLLPQGAEALESADGNLLLRIEDLRIGFFGYGYPLVGNTDSVQNVALASIVDIGLMKLDALGSRGSRKDFYDMYVIAQHIPLADLLALGRTKYAYVRNFELIVLESMVLFDNGDRDIQPELFFDVPWSQIKEFFLGEAHNLGVNWLDE